MNTLITGGYGFIGTNLSNQLYKRGDIICCPDRLNGVYQSYYSNVDVIYHLAAYSRVQGSNNPENKVFENNIKTLKDSLELARITKSKLIFTSTSYCIVDPNANYYAFSKHIGEELCQFYAKTYGVDVSVVRLFNVYGNQLSSYPEWKLGVVDRFLLDKRLGRGYTLNNSGEQRRDYIHVSDVCNALILIGEEQTNSEDIYEVGTGKLHSVNEIAKMIFGDIKPSEQKIAEGEIFESKSFGGIELTKKLGWEYKIKLEEYIKNYIKS